MAGGKLTTYRRIAGHAADVAAAALGHGVASSTASLPLLGAGFDRSLLVDGLASAGIDREVAGPTVDRNGGDVDRIRRIVEERPELAAPLGDRRTSLADVVHAVRHEGASRLSDITLRRTHLAWFTEDHSRGDIERIADVMGAELGWSSTRRAAELAEHETELLAEAL